MSKAILEAIRTKDLAGLQEAVNARLAEKIKFEKEMEEIAVAQGLNEQSTALDADVGSTAETIGSLASQPPNSSAIQGLAQKVASAASKQGSENVEDEKFAEIAYKEIDELGDSDTDAKARQQVYNKIVKSVREYDLMPGQQAQKHGQKVTDDATKVSSSKDYDSGIASNVNPDYYKKS